ncbi:hypothetical protein GCM10028807_42600 [Spirosoma daeguense]
MSRFRLACLLTASLFLRLTNFTFAQTSITPATPVGTWFIGTLVLPPGEKKWGGFAEIQARGNDFMRQFFYNELKGGVSYDLDQNFSLMLAGGRYATYDFLDLSTGPLNTEKRLWQQLTINQYLSRLKFEHRYRIEQRWFTFRDGADQFRNRIRYRLNMFIPINNRTITDKTFFLSAYDEIFLNPIGPVFERNRLYAGVGYQFDKHLILQLGMVNQTNYNPAVFESGIFKPQSASGKYNVVIGVIYRLKRLGDSERLPTQPD